MKITQTPRLLSVVLVGALAVAACGGSDSASDADPCEAGKKLKEAFDVGEGAESEADFESAIGNFATALEDFAKSAPDEIKADAELLADATRQLADVPAGEEPSAEVAALLEDDSYDAAGDRLETYLGDNCDIEL